MDSKLAFLNSKGFDTAAGISYLGDAAMYNDILSDFKNGFVEQMANIRKSFEANDWNNYVILVHALKSNCRTLGITDLAQMAYDHELKGKDNDIAYIQGHVNELFAKANEVYLIMEEYFKM